MIKVLIVDDEYIMRQGLRYMIHWEQEGYEIVGEATNGKDALRLTEELKPHIIISDIVMPLLDGVDFSDAVHRMYPQTQMIILSGYDKFEYVKQTLMNGVVDYILKPTLNPTELLAVLKRAVERIPGYRLAQEESAISYERILERYLLGHDKELDTAVFEPIFGTDYLMLYALNIHKENASGQDMTELLHKKIERKLQELPADLPHLLLFIREEQVCVVFGYHLSQKGMLMAQIQELNEQLVILCESVFGVVSHSFTDFAQINKIYEQDILSNIDKGFYHRGTVLFEAAENEKQVQHMELPKFDFFRYNRLLGSRQYAEAEEMLVQYNASMLGVQMDVYRMKNQMKNMIYNFLDFLQVSEQEKEANRYEYFKQIDRAAYAEEYQECVKQLLEQIMVLSGQKPTFNDERMERMLAYIESNYREELKLEDLAEEFSFNYHYLSAYFNQQMKEGFSDYLNRIRIEKACQMLEENQLSIAQISEEVGYSEHSYFSRVFKKITGKTPSVWRRESL